jgi:putative chitinase
MTDWLRVLHAMAPHARPSILDGFAQSLPRVCAEYDISTPLRQAHFLAQCCHESAGFATTEEYASGRAYEGRRDLGNVKAGDGPLFKGRGLIQLTGRANYQAEGDKLGVEFIKDPELAGEFPWAALTAGLYWQKRGINRFADADDIARVTRAVNGGYNGLDSRKAYLAKAKRILIGSPALGLMSAPDDELPDVAPPKGKTIAIQDRLRDIGYFPGASDGDHGAATTGALASFQKDADLPVTGKIDEATEDALWSATARPVSDARATATADDLREAGSATIAAADGVKAGGNRAVLGAGGVAFGTAAELGSTALNHGRDVLEKVNDAKDTASGFGDLFSGLSDKVPWLVSHWGLIVSFVAACFIAFEIYRLVHRGADRVIAERVRKHRTAADLSL